MDTKLDSKIKLFFLEKLREEFRLVPKSQTSLMALGVIGSGYGARSTHPPTKFQLRAELSPSIYNPWLKEIQTDKTGLENTFDYFEREGVIIDYDLMSDLRIYFPENFKEKYHKCKEKILASKNIEITKHDSIVESARENSPNPVGGQNQEAKYFIEINDDTREIVLNGDYIMVRPQLGKENGYFIEYMISHPNQLVKKEDIENMFRIKITKTFYHILSDLKFNPELRRIFFPEMAEKFAKFRNNITEKDLESIGINKKKLDTHIKTLKKIKRKHQKK